MVGIIGGIGPLSTVYFMEMIIRKVDAKSNKDHIDMVVFNHATIPDRTAYIMGDSDENPATVMAKDAQKLEKLGVDFIVMPCNTAHHFYDYIQSKVKTKIINIIEETVNYTMKTIPNVKKIGILATSGTVFTNSYQLFCKKYNVECEVPSDSYQQKLMHIIYDDVKASKKVDIDLFLEIIKSLEDKGCDAIILGCTELSIIREDFNLTDKKIVDSLDVLARKTITSCGKKIKEKVSIQ